MIFNTYYETINIMFFRKKFLFYIFLTNNLFSNIHDAKENKNLELDLINFAIEHKIFMERLNLGGCFLLNNLNIKKIGLNNFNFFISYKVFKNEFEYFNLNLNVLCIFNFTKVFKGFFKDIVIRIDLYYIFMCNYFNFFIDLFILNHKIFIYYYGFISKKKFKIYSKLNLRKLVNIMKVENYKQNINNNKEKKHDLDKIKDALELYNAIYNENELTIIFNSFAIKNEILSKETFSVQEFFEKSENYEKLKTRISKEYKHHALEFHPDKNKSKDAEEKFRILVSLKDHVENL